MFFTNERVESEILRPGDHICCRRYGLVYAHHGIYLGGDQVVHYSDSAGIGRKAGACVGVSTLSEFLRGDPLRRVKYSDAHSGEQALLRAEKLLEAGGYSVIWNNCEHFATFCVTGRRRSVQVLRALTIAASAVAAVALMGVKRGRA